MTQTAKVRMPAEITSAQVNHCIAKEDFTAQTHYGHEVKFFAGQAFYGVKSDSSDATYLVWWNTFFQCWDCTCAGCTHTYCKHRTGVQQIIALRKEMEREAKEAERAAYREFEFQCGSYSIPGLY